AEPRRRRRRVRDCAARRGASAARRRRGSGDALRAGGHAQHRQRGQRAYGGAAPHRMITHVYDDAVSTANACAHRIADLVKKTVASKSRATVALSGGTTPALMFEELAKH